MDAQYAKERCEALIRIRTKKQCNTDKFGMLRVAYARHAKNLFFGGGRTEIPMKPSVIYGTNSNAWSLKGHVYM